MIVSGGLLLISQRSNDSIENCMIEDYSNFDISVSESENTLDSSLKTTDEEKAAIQSECIVISELYREIYQQAPKVPSQYFGAENDITQETIDEIENILIAAGYSVINSDSIYPEYLEHSDCVNAFWECVKQQTDAEVSFWGVSSTGGLYYRKFCFIDGKSYGIFAGADWKDDGKLELLYAEKREIFYWDMTYNADFIYRDLYLDRHWDAAHLLRLHPVDKPMYDLTMKYILPIGYHNVNLFLLDWSSDDYGNLCFNDLLDYLYRLNTTIIFMPEITLVTPPHIPIVPFPRNFLRTPLFRILTSQWKNFGKELCMMQKMIFTRGKIFPATMCYISPR